MGDDDWTPAQIMAAISAALRDENMPAVVSLIQMLAVRDPNSARLILDAVAVIADV